MLVSILTKPINELWRFKWSQSPQTGHVGFYGHDYGHNDAEPVESLNPLKRVMLVSILRKRFDYGSRAVQCLNPLKRVMLVSITKKVLTLTSLVNSLNPLKRVMLVSIECNYYQH